MVLVYTRFKIQTSLQTNIGSSCIGLCYFILLTILWALRLYSESNLIDEKNTYSEPDLIDEKILYMVMFKITSWELPVAEATQMKRSTRGGKTKLLKHCNDLQGASCSLLLILASDGFAKFWVFWYKWYQFILIVAPAPPKGPVPGYELTGDLALQQSRVRNSFLGNSTQGLWFLHKEKTFLGSGNQDTTLSPYHLLAFVHMFTLQLQLLRIQGILA